MPTSMPDSFPEYTRRLLRYLADEAPRSAMEQSATRLTDSIQNLRSVDLRIAEAPGKWSIIEVLQHLADVEWVLGFRYRLLAAENGCALPLMNQDAWTQNLAYGENATATRALKDFAALRNINLRFLETLRPEQWQHVGTHPERGPESLEHIVRLYAAHDCYHIHQIGRIRQVLGI